jgi:hypothetical protein
MRTSDTPFMLWSVLFCTSMVRASGAPPGRVADGVMGESFPGLHPGLRNVGAPPRAETCPFRAKLRPELKPAPFGAKQPTEMSKLRLVSGVIEAKRDCPSVKRSYLATFQAEVRLGIFEADAADQVAK